MADIRALEAALQRDGFHAHYRDLGEKSVLLVAWSWNESAVPPPQ
jgi:hypothetical protein